MAGVRFVSKALIGCSVAAMAIVSQGVKGASSPFTALVPAITGLSLTNTKTAQPVGGFDPIPEENVIERAALRSRNLSIRAIVPSGVGLSAVAFGLDSTYRHVETRAPYNPCGNLIGGTIPFHWPPLEAEGSHVLTVTPLTSNGPGTPVDLHFSATSSAGGGSGGRQVISLDPGWRFLRRDAPGAQTVGIEDSQWPLINLPHTWNNIDGQTHTDYYRGIGWYRRHVTLDPAWRGKKLFVRFGAANSVASTYVNGTLVGTHQGGYTAFAYDITRAALLGQDNVIAVKVDNSYNPDVAPLSADFTLFGGIYRDVSLIVTPAVCISPLDYASPGVYLTPSIISRGFARVGVKVKIANESGLTESFSVAVSLLDAAGHTVTTATSWQVVPAGGRVDALQDLSVPNPHVWDGNSDPYLYAARVRLQRGNGAVIDEVDQPLGFRYYSVDPDHGVSLNGHRVEIHGVSWHQDFFNKGWALTDADRRVSMDLIKEMGVNALRLAHYPRDEGTYRLADQNGLMVWSEIPLINNTSSSQAFRDNIKQQLVELIRQNYNHPSILVWGLFNELRRSTPSVTNALVGELDSLAKREDPSRLTTAASDTSASDPLSFHTDLIAFNLYDGWYSGSISQIGGDLDSHRRALPGRPVGLSEYGAGACVDQHQDPPLDLSPSGPFHPEERQNLFHEAYYSAIKERPYLWARFIWNMFDFASASKNEGCTPGRNDKGLVTYDRRTRKDAFYFYKSQWNSAPTVYITSRRFVNRPSAKVDVKVYSNQDSVELLINGVLRARAWNPGDMVFHFPNLTLKPGTNTLKAVGTTGNNLTVDSVVWNAP